MNRRRIIWIVVAILILSVVSGLAIAFDPAARVQGWVRGEPFFQDRSATSWRRELRTPDENIAATASTALTNGKDKSIPVCVWLLKNADEPQVRLRAAESLGKMGKEAAPAGPDLVAAFNDSDPLVQAVAIRLVGDLAPDVPGAVAGFIRLFPNVEAIRAVAKFKRAGAEAVPKLIELTKHVDPIVRRQSVRTLGKIGVPALTSLPALIALVETDPVPGVREQSAEALGEIGPAAAEGIPVLVKALKDADAMVRRDAVRSLGQMGPLAKGFVADVRALTKDPDERVKKAATDAARLIDPTGKSKSEE
jgi:HEAT repeat protein